MVTTAKVLPTSPELVVADSQFLGYAIDIGIDDGVTTTNERKLTTITFQRTLKALHPAAAHVPIFWCVDSTTPDPCLSDDDLLGYDEDGEPDGAVGPHVLNVLSRYRANDDRRRFLMVGIVRYFGGKYLGVTCGRLTQCYERIVELTLHRYCLRDGQDAVTPLVTEIGLSQSEPIEHNLFGLGEGDTELHLNVITEDPSTIVGRLIDELQFDGFKGAAGEELPRLQSLQADGVNTTNQIPVYRYPGNYSGDEWTTFAWSPTSLHIKRAVEESLLPLVDQTMNHAVANYYRAGKKDFIAHHSDKDLDLNRDGVIVSVSLGDERVLELRRRSPPQDIIRVMLPHGSMLVLGPKTNQYWTHSILPKDDNGDCEKGQINSYSGCRLSLTMRDVKTFQDLSTGKLYGQGVIDNETGRQRTLSDIRRRSMLENITALGVAGLSAAITTSQTTIFARMTNIRSTTTPSRKESLSPAELLIAGACAVTTASAVAWKLFGSKKRDSQLQERSARKFFSLKSSSGTKY